MTSAVSEGKATDANSAWINHWASAASPTASSVPPVTTESRSERNGTEPIAISRAARGHISSKSISSTCRLVSSRASRITPSRMVSPLSTTGYGPLALSGGCPRLSTQSVASMMMAPAPISGCLGYCRDSAIDPDRLRRILNKTGGGFGTRLPVAFQ